MRGEIACPIVLLTLHSFSFNAVLKLPSFCFIHRHLCIFPFNLCFSLYLLGSSLASNLLHFILVAFLIPAVMCNNKSNGREKGFTMATQLK